MHSTEAKKIVEGIPFFSEDRYWGKAPKEELEKALVLIDMQGWSAFKEKYEGAFDFTSEENRADWRFPIALTKDATVLDIGAGMGRSSIPLARVVKKVIAVDQSFLRMKFLKRRAAQEHLTNIDVYVGDLFDLSFPKESFDLIVMNGVLEWVGLTDRFKNPREAQEVALRMCKDMLKKGGTLYIGIENRFALSYMRGIDHSGLRFTSYMPRFIADLYMKARGRVAYKTYTYTAAGYRKLLESVGFKIETYLVYPGYNMPRILIHHGNLNELSYVIRTFMNAQTPLKKILRRVASIPLVLRLYRFVFFSFALYAQK